LSESMQQPANASSEGPPDSGPARPGPVARWTLPRSSRVAAILILIGALGALVFAYQTGPKHFLVVTPDVLYRSAVLEPGQLGRVVNRLGVRTVVNLRSVLENEKGDWHAAQRAELEGRGVEMLDIPMHTGWPPERPAIETWLDLMNDPERQPVLVHCEYGVVRSGMMSSIYEVEVLGRDPGSVWSDFELFGSEMREPVRSRVESFVEGYRPLEQRDP
jgi:protein tyrosine phosphatase (PTP) superfamily phosphohydrolase (DUF442 family)